MIDEPTNLKVSAVFVLFQLIWQIVSLAYLRYTWVDLRKMHSQVENKDNPSAAVRDSYIVFDRARSCFGWLTCLRVIVWSGVCCASLVLALKYMSACSLLTLCLTVSGSYVKCACHKNTFHINLPDPLVETLALMNHDLSENESLFTGNCSIWRIVSSSFRLGTLLSASLESFFCSVDNCPLFWLCSRSSVLLRGIPGQMTYVMHQTSSTERKGESMGGQVTAGQRIIFLLVSMSRGVGRNQTYRDFNKLYFKWENSYCGVLYASLL